MQRYGVCYQYFNINNRQTNIREVCFVPNSELLKKIQDLREYMNKLIDEKDSLLDPEIIKVSKMIDTLLNEYEKNTSK